VKHVKVSAVKNKYYIKNTAAAKSVLPYGCATSPKPSQINPKFSSTDASAEY
jgi:hypothetical protein